MGSGYLQELSHCSGNNDRLATTRCCTHNPAICIIISVCVCVCVGGGRMLARLYTYIHIWWQQMIVPHSVIQQLMVDAGYRNKQSSSNKAIWSNKGQCIDVATDHTYMVAWWHLDATGKCCWWGVVFSKKVLQHGGYIKQFTNCHMKVSMLSVLAWIYAIGGVYLKYYFYKY